jgi:hypothetical protein
MLRGAWSLRWLVFFGVLSTLTGLALSAVAHGLFPARFASPRALRRLRLGAIGVAMAMVLLELAARRLAPWGGAGWRIPLGAARLLMFGASFSALGVLVARVLVRLVPERAPAVTTAPAQTAPEAATELVPPRAARPSCGAPRRRWVRRRWARPSWAIGSASTWR